MALPKIAIVGAGPAGLTLAKILLHHNPCIPVTVFERDSCPEARSYSGTLYLLFDAAQAALEKAGIWDDFLEDARYPDEDLIIADRFGNVHLDLKEIDFGRPEIDRVALRRVLLDALPTDTLKWNSPVQCAHLNAATGKGTLHFADGRTANDFDLLVGADGAWSKLRTQLVTPVPPFYAGIAGVEARIPTIDTAHPALARMLGARNYLAFGEEEGNCLLCQRDAAGDVRVYAVGRRPEAWVVNSGLDFSDDVAVRSALLLDYADWSAPQRAIIEACEGFVPRALHMLPVGLRWATRKGVTLLGDAAHLMTPFAGEGINAALADAAALAAAILEEPGDLEGAVERYEKWMFATAREATQRTWEDLQDRFEKGGCVKYRDMVEAQLTDVEVAREILEFGVENALVGGS